MPEIATYSCSKFAVRAITEALDIDFERHYISVSDIMVGYVQTPLLEKTQVSFSLQRSEVKVTAEQVAETVWKAVHSNKAHWQMNLKLMLFIIWLFPFLKHSLMKRSVPVKPK
jgi:short-subunit dehydrogenase